MGLRAISPFQPNDCKVMIFARGADRVQSAGVSPGITTDPDKIRRGVFWWPKIDPEAGEFSGAEMIDFAVGNSCRLF